MKGLKSFRERMGYRTQTALANALDRTIANVSEWELGKGFPSYQVIKRLLELGATVEELFDVPYKGSATPLKDLSDAELGDFVRRGLKFLLLSGDLSKEMEINKNG
jgi:transcriptional regulator with XRE-family HTH domain